MGAGVRHCVLPWAAPPSHRPCTAAAPLCCAGQIVIGVQKNGLRPPWPQDQLPELQELYNS